ncbi:hypothetical protein P280DRAFT_469500 [Massarina eburnea CBS 473.64]|uniref:DUF7053 domain-containing protein n=1 Tax=Massarina eburnea CBS 473.64 TaxID=1395130 RepID=A0A6A6RZN9_9PLEO|nr:hypothetical protein P280DRAFT_469500 [Massarina eburnea CBS 473.64]
MSKTSVFTSCTPLPAGITRQSVLETYHNHIEMIELNPLVVERFRCKPPNYSPAEEFHSTWYTIKDKVSYLPGGLATGSVSYHACFHDLPDGLQTHVYAPLGLDIRAKWSIGGSLPGELKGPTELGIGAPPKGLYIREDVRMKCNIMMMGFVKKTFKESHAKLVDRLVEKAHILESEAANMRLKMLKGVAPGERMGHGSIFIAPPPGYQEGQHHSVYSNGSSQSPAQSPGLSQASAVTNQSGYLSSPRQSHQPSNHRHSHSQDCDHVASLQFGISPSANAATTADEASEEDDQLTQLSYLPSTTYNPRVPVQETPRPEPRRTATYTLLPAVAYTPNPNPNPNPNPIAQRPRARTESSTYKAYQPPPTELPAEGPPVPPKNNYAAELPA